MTRVAVIQAEVAPDLAAGLDRVETLAREARDSGAELIVFPETYLPGYPVWLDVCRDAGLWDSSRVKAVFRRLAENSVDVAGEAGCRLGRVAAELGVTLVIGASERVERGPGSGTLYNALLTYGPDGALLNHHRKLVPAYTERLVWGGGDTGGLRSIETPAGRLGGLVCWEHWMPLARQALHDSGEDVHVAVWSAVKEMHQVASRAYAFEGRCFVLAAGGLMRAAALPPELKPHPDYVSSRDDWVLRGGSAIIGPDGAYLAGPVFDQPAVLTADLDLARVRDEKMTLDVAGHFQRPDCFRFRVRSVPRVAE